jgi:hypothetical protein
MIYDFRRLETILRIHQLCRSHGSFRSHQSDGIICSKVCSNGCFPANPVVYLMRNSQALGYQATPAELPSAAPTMVTLPLSQICLSQPNIVTDLTLKSSRTEDFEVPTKQITLGLIACNNSNPKRAVPSHTNTTLPPQLPVTISEQKDSGNNTTLRTGRHLLSHPLQLADASTAILQLPHGMNLSSEVRCMCSRSQCGSGLE